MNTDTHSVQLPSIYEIKKMMTEQNKMAQAPSVDTNTLIAEQIVAMVERDTQTIKQLMAQAALNINEMIQAQEKAVHLMLSKVVDNPPVVEQKKTPIPDRKKQAKANRESLLNTPCPIPDREAQRQEILATDTHAFLKCAAIAIIVYGSSNHELSAMLNITLQSAANYRNRVSKEGFSSKTRSLLKKA